MNINQLNNNQTQSIKLDFLEKLIKKWLFIAECSKMKKKVGKEKKEKAKKKKEKLFLKLLVSKAKKLPILLKDVLKWSVLMVITSLMLMIILPSPLRIYHSIFITLMYLLLLEMQHHYLFQWNGTELCNQLKKLLTCLDVSD